MGANDEFLELLIAPKGVSKKEALGPNTLKRLIWAEDIICNSRKINSIFLIKRHFSSSPFKRLLIASFLSAYIFIFLIIQTSFRSAHSFIY